jgi:hypothetical protein
VNQLIYQINNDKDFDDYILKNASRASAVKPELQYVKHPTQTPAQSYPSLAPTANNDRRTSMPPQIQPPVSFSTQQSETNPLSFQQQQPPQHSEPESQNGFSAHQASSQPPQAQAPAPTYGKPAYSPPAANSYPQPEYPRGPVGQATAQQTSGILYNSPQPPVNPVFGITLEDLFHRDGSPVPMVVYQCIQAVDLFGLEVEGIYRIPGTSSHIQQMKALFDSGKFINFLPLARHSRISDASQVDFRNPEAFQHDVNSVAGLLKQFFRELPDPLLTREFYSKFIDAARVDDDTMRRDSMHALINALPDPNYATLRALVLHLHRVQQSSEINRMSTANLGICWAYVSVYIPQWPCTDNR